MSVDKRSSKRLKLLMHYLAATKNEVAVDKSVYLLCSCEPSSLAYAPRPAKLLSVVGENLRLARFVIVLIGFIWRIGGDKCWFFIEFLRLMALKDRFDSRYLELPSNSSVGFCSSLRALNVLQSAGALADVGCLIKWPGCDALSLGPKVSSVDFSTLLTWRDCVRALRLSCIVSRKMRSRFFFKNWSLQSYTAFKWIAFYLAVEKIPAQEFIVADHYNRWAVLMDRLVAEKKNAVLTLVQHGALLGLTSTSMDSNFSLDIPTRLKSVTKLYVYDEGAARVFGDNILSSSDLGGIDINFFKPKISLSPVLADSSVLSVLIVGHAICEDFHLFVYDQLVHDFDVNFFYKPHPTVAPSKAIKSRNWHVVDGADFFPEVDLLISYPSTLVAEYEGCGIGAVVHPLAIESDGFHEVLSIISNKLHSLK
ncbi:hypothetical protein [Pseudomonas sp. CFBP 5748]